MSEPSAPRPGTPYEIPEDGSLGLLAVGYRGLEAWRAKRDPAWLERRKVEHEAALAKIEAEKAKAEAEKEAEAADADETPEGEA